MKKIDNIYRVSLITIIVNIILFVFKLIAGIIGNSKAMISDAIHSGSDILSTIIVMFGIFISRKKSDKKHPYGHEKFECVVAIMLAVMLLGIGLGIGFDGILVIIRKSYIESMFPSYIALFAAIVSILVKEWMYWYTIKVAIRENSTSLKADAWHHRSDALSSVGSLIGIGGAMLGFKILDSIASVIIAFCILKVAVDILKDGIDKMVDTSASDEVIKKIINLVSDINCVANIDSLKTRQFGTKFYIDLEIAVDDNLSIVDAHDIAHQVHDIIEDNIKTCKHCMVHVNPIKKPLI